MIREQTEHPLVRQIDEFFPIVEEAIRTIDSKMKGLVSVARAQAEPAEVPLIERAIGEYNDQMGRLVGLTADLRRPMDDVKATCQALQSIREAGERWLERVVPDSCGPLAENLRRENMQGFFSFSWKSLAVEDYWNYVDKCHNSSAALAGLGSDVGGSLINLADAINRQTVEVGIAVTNVIKDIVTAVAAAVALYAAVGAVTGSAPGAVIGAVVGVIAGVVVAVLGLEVSLKQYDLASRIVSDAGAEELRELKSSVNSTGHNRWGAHYESFEGNKFRQRGEG